MADDPGEACGPGLALSERCQWSFDREPAPRTPQSCSGGQAPGSGKAGHAGTSCLRAGGFVLTPAHQPPLSSVGPPHRVRRWQAGRREARASLLGLWEGSQWFAKNSPKSWPCLPVGSRAPPWSRAKEPADGPFMLPVTGTQNGGGPGSSRLSLGEALLLFPDLWLGPQGREDFSSTQSLS